MAAPPNTYHILRFVSVDGETHFRVKKNTPLRKPMQNFSERFGLSLCSLRFYLKETYYLKIKPKDTPRKLWMEKDAYVHVLNKNDVKFNIREQAHHIKSKIKSAKEERKRKRNSFEGVKLIVRSNVNTVHFRLKPTSSLKKLMIAYSQKTGVRVQELRFTFNGEAIKEDDTPQALKMKEDDVITVERKIEEFGDELDMNQLSIH